MEQSDSQRPAILVLDDDADFAEGLKELLERLRYRVVATGAVAEAREALADDTVRIVLVDLKLGALNGLEVVHSLMEAFSDRLFIMITAYGSVDSAIHAMQVGAYDYLRKPFGAEEVSAVLQRAADRLASEDAREAAEAELASANVKLRHINDRLAHLVQLTQGFAACTERSELYPELLSAFAESMGAAGGSVYAVAGEALVLVASLDPGHAPERIALPLDPASVFGRLIASRKPLLLETISATKDVLPSGWQGYGDASLLAFPLLGPAGEPHAVVSLHSKGTPPFTPMDLELGVILAGHVCESLRATIAYERLGASERKYRSLAEGSVLGICVCDAERLYYANAHFRRIVGLEAGETPAGSGGVAAMLPPDLLRRLQAVGEDPVEPAAPMNRLIEIDRPAGDTCWVEAMVQPVRWGDQPALQITVVDRTNWVDAERRVREQHRQLVQADKLAALGTMLSGIAHEINNPMNIIGLNAEMLLVRWAELQQRVGAAAGHGNDSPVAATLREVMGEHLPRTVEQIQDSIGRVKHIVGRVRDFSRRGAESSRDPVDVNAVVASAIDLARSEIDRRTTALQVVLGDALPPVHGDRIELAQVVVNLLINACQALTNNGQSVSVSTGYEAASRAVEIRICDQGPGIDEDVLSSVFDPFFTTKQDEGGTGLGLYVCNGIVKEHGGRLSLTAREGGGTCARVTLPCGDRVAATG